MGYRIAQVGSFDVENYGDLLFSDVFEAQMRKRLDIDEIVFFSADTCTIPNRNVMTHSVQEMETLHCQKPFDAVVIGGGDLIHFGRMMILRPFIAPVEQLYDAPSMWIIPALISERYGIPLMLNAPGVPAAFTDNEKRVVRNLLGEAMYLSVRDANAQKELAAALSDKEITVVPDTVLSISTLFPKEELEKRLHEIYPQLKAGNYLLAQINYKFTEEDIRILKETLTQIRQNTGLDILIQPIGYSMGDTEAIAAMKKDLPADFIVCDRHLSQYDLLAVIASAAFYIGSSLHGAITSASYGVRVLVCNVNHYNKSSGFLSLISRPEACVDDMHDLKEAFNAQYAKQPADIAEQLDQINAHFDHMADVIQSGRKPASGFDPHALSEQLFWSSNCEHAQAAVIMRQDAEIRALTKERDEARQAYEQTLQSTSWKITAPLRKLKGGK